MEHLHLIREILMGLGALIAVALLISVLFTLFYLKFNEQISDENRLLLQSLSVTISSVCLLCAIKQFVPFLTEHPLPISLRHLTAGNILQLYLPIHIYTLQRSCGYFSKIRDVIFLSGGVLLLNIILVIVSFVIEVERLIFIQYFIQILLISCITYQYYTLNSAFKDAFKASNGNSFYLKGDIFLYVISSTITIILALALFANIISYRIEAMKVILGLINIVLLIKVLYYSSSEKYTPLKKEYLRSPSTLSSNNLFENKSDDDLKNRLLQYFQTEKPYLNPKLTITEVALYLYSNKTYLSRLINDHYNNNFSQFVNFYRIDYAKNLFLKDNHLSITQLCDLSGFGSMATFTMAFRLYVANSPAEWCKEQKIKAKNDIQEED